MKTYYEQLRELLCEVPEIKKDLEELRFWCEIERYWNIYTLIEWKHFIDENWKYQKSQNNVNDFSKTIIWNPIEERHIRMYCDNKSVEFMSLYNCNFKIREKFFDKLTNDFWYKIALTLKVDNIKSFHLQDEQVYKQLVEYFKSLK